MPAKTDLPKLRQRALDAGDYYQLVTSVIPYDSWSSPFHSAFFATVYGRHTDWETWGIGYMKERELQVEHLAGLLKKNHPLSEEHARIIKSKLSPKLQQVAKKSPDMVPFLDAWEQKMAEVNVFVEQHKASDDTSSSDSEHSDDDDSEPEVRTCVVCKPPSSAEGPRSKKCDLVHPQTCAAINKGPGTGLECKECPPNPDESDDGGRASKRQRKGDKQTLPEDENVEVDTGMSRNAVIHGAQLFAPRTNEYLGGSPLKTNTSPKLAMVDLTRSDFLFKRNPASKNAMKTVLEGLLEALDQKGTIACAIPRPWYEKGSLVYEAFKELTDAEVEDCPLVISYTSVSGGAQPRSKEGHMRNQQEHVLVVHRKGSDGTTGFTFNKRVVVTDVFGHSQGAVPHARHVIPLETLPAGAPNGGSQTFFPPTACQYFIARYTNAGDTVLGIGVETTSAPEDAIARGRRVEFYVTDESKRAALQTKIGSAFHKAHSSGMFQSRRGGEGQQLVLVGPKCLPTGLPTSTAPTRVLESLREEIKKQPDELAAAFAVAQALAKATHIVLQGDHSAPKLVLRKPKRSSSRSSREISDFLVWGDLVVYPSPSAAKDSLDQESVDEEFVRLLRIASTAQLQVMLEPGTERCTPEAALYLRVDPTCPVFWARYSSNKKDADLDVCCDIPQRGDRTKILAKVRFCEDGSGGVKIRHVRNKPRATSVDTERPLSISTSCGRVVGSEMFDSAALVREEEGEGEGEEEEEEEEEKNG